MLVGPFVRRSLATHAQRLRSGDKREAGDWLGEPVASPAQFGGRPEYSGFSQPLPSRRRRVFETAPESERARWAVPITQLLQQERVSQSSDHERFHRARARGSETSLGSRLGLLFSFCLWSEIPAAAALIIRGKK